MNLPFNEVTQLRERIANYAGQFTDEQLREQKLEELLSFLTKSAGREVTKEDLGQIFYHEFHQKKDLTGSLMKDHPVWMLHRYVTSEDESLVRIGKLVGKPVSGMTTNELTDATIKLFTLTRKEYESLAEQRGVKLTDEHKFEQAYDSTTLPGLLQVMGVQFGRADLRQRILDNGDFGLGYFAGMFRGSFGYFSKEESFDRGINGLYGSFHQELSKQRENLEKHLVAEENLKARHTIAPPKLLIDRTMSLGIIPYAIDFTPDGRLVVLGGKVDANEDDRESSQMLLNIYDINTGKLLQSTNTRIHSRFDGAGGMASSFQGSLTVGQDGIIYVNGGSRRYSPNLEQLADNESNFRDAIELLKDKEILGWNKEIFQVAQSDDVLYFALQPSHFPKCYDNVIVATDGKKIIGVPLAGYSPSSGSSSNDQDDTARIIVHGNDIYFKASKQLLAVNRSCTEKAWQTPFRMIAGERGINNPIPSNHCLSPEGVAYAVTQFEEEAVQSIHGYVRSKERGEFATHVYPEDCPGGWAAFRSMAISKDGILAYTSQEGNKVHLYKLEK